MSGEDEWGHMKGILDRKKSRVKPKARTCQQCLMIRFKVCILDLNSMQVTSLFLNGAILL
jgi:hypothetical protein